ncbi:hypothetical protein CYMTET_42927 [Cymbomonas tetramitiformis]|uniref:Uncharacterized protein n=1 Tax=Cymbomonas tetramitiformis TaxID=36881 RepID=A0AAE0C370_9CHLO|nr:hypothetical protein CYMTET_42927 [Cymbomonas tetramitiformis]
MSEDELLAALLAKRAAREAEAVPVTAIPIASPAAAPPSASIPHLMDAAMPAPAGASERPNALQSVSDLLGLSNTRQRLMPGHDHAPEAFAAESPAKKSKN